MHRLHGHPIPTIGLLTEPADEVQPAINRQLERGRAFSKVSVHDVYGGVPVRVEDAAVRRVEPATLSSAPVRGLRSTIHPAGIFRRNCFYPFSFE